MRLTGKVALITGAGRGIGLAIAERFAAEGATVWLLDNDAVGGQAAAEALQARGLSAVFTRADLADPDQILRTVQSLVQRHGALDILVNNAAILLPKTVAEISVADWDRLMAVNLRAPFLLVQAALEALKQTRGTVLNLSSTAGIQVFSPNLPYCTAKAGLISMTKSLAQELHPWGIRVNCLCPGAVDTPALHSDIAARGGDEQTFARMQASGYLTTSAQMAEVALYLVSPAAQAVNGCIMVADAGALVASS